MRGRTQHSCLLAFSLHLASPSGPKQARREEKDAEAREGREQMEEVNVTDNKMHSDRRTKAGAAHHRDNFN